MSYILLFISAIIVNNVVLTQFLGICPFLGVSKRISTAMGMGAAVTFVIVIATIVTFLVQKTPTLPSTGRVSPIDYHQLRGIRGSNPDHPEGLQYHGSRCILRCHSIGFWIGFGYLRRHPRTAGTC